MKSLTLIILSSSLAFADVPGNELYLYKSSNLIHAISKYKKFSAIPLKALDDCRMIYLSGANPNAFTFDSPNCTIRTRSIDPLRNYRSVTSHSSSYTFEYIPKSNSELPINFSCKMVRADIDLHPIENNTPPIKNKIIYVSSNWQQQKYTLIIIHEDLKL